MGINTVNMCGIVNFRMILCKSVNDRQSSADYCGATLDSQGPELVKLCLWPRETNVAPRSQCGDTLVSRGQILPKDQ